MDKIKIKRLVEQFIKELPEDFIFTYIDIEKVLYVATVKGENCSSINILVEKKER